MEKKLVYCLDNQIIQEELEIIGKLLHTKDDELLEMCIDTLRSFDNEMGHSYIKMHPEIIKEAKERMDTAGNATKRMLQCFLKCLIFFKLGLYFRTPNNIQLLHIY